MIASNDKRQESKQVSSKPPARMHWWNAGIDRMIVQGLLKKRDAPALCFLAAWLGMIMGTLTLLAVAWETLWVIPTLIVHGSILSFAYAISHECAHGTAFRTTWLNEGVFYLTSFVFGEEPMYRRYSHSRHHAYTWYPGFDNQMPYQNPVTLRAYLRETLGLASLYGGLRQMGRIRWDG